MRYGFPSRYGRIEYGRMANWITFAHYDRDSDTGEKRLRWIIKGFLDRLGQPRWYTQFDHRGLALERFEGEWLLEASRDPRDRTVIDWWLEVEDLLGLIPGFLTPTIPVGRWLRLNVGISAAKAFSARPEVPGSERMSKNGCYVFISPGLTPAQIALDRVIRNVQKWGVDCKYPEPEKSCRDAEHSYAWVGRDAGQAPLRVELAARDVKSLWGREIDAEQLQHVYDAGTDGDYWSIDGIFVNMQEIQNSRDPNWKPRGVVESMKRYGVKFRPVWSGDFFLTHADHLRAMAQASA